MSETCNFLSVVVLTIDGRQWEGLHSQEAMQQFNPDGPLPCLETYLGLLATVFVTPQLIFLSALLILSSYDTSQREN